MTITSRKSRPHGTLDGADAALRVASQPAASTVSVIVAAYAEDRWHDTVEAIDSVLNQSVLPLEVILVIDHNPALAERARAELRGVKILENVGPRGASGARNTGVMNSRGDFLVFLDDDAVATPDWVRLLCRHFADADVVGVGGGLTPAWPATRPQWFPREFDWVVGGSYTGMPEAAAPVRNVWSGNMAIRRTAFDAVDGFRPGFGKTGGVSRPEDTDLCLRVREAVPGGYWMYEPGAEVAHKVPPDRSTPSFFLKRCWNEGRGKAALAKLVGVEASTATERRYATQVLPRGFFRELRLGVLGRNTAHLQRSITILAGLAWTVAGMLTEIVAGMRRSVPVRDPQPAGAPTGGINGDGGATFYPVHIAEWDVLESFPAILTDGQGDHGGDRVQLLVRMASEPVGWVDVEFAGTASLAGIAADAAWRTFGAQINDRLARSGLASVAGIPVSGLEIDPELFDFVIERDRLLQDAPDVSVVLCTRDRPERLAKCVRQLALQHYPRFEVVVVDNAPGDPGAVPAALDALELTVPVRYVVEPRGGLSWARNTGWRTARAELIAFIDDDEVPDKFWLAEVVRGFAAGDRVGCVAGVVLPAELRTQPQHWFEQFGGHSKGRGFTRVEFGPGHPQSPLYPLPPFGTGANMAFRRDVLASIDGFHVALGAGSPTNGSEDTLAFTRVMLARHTMVYQPSAVTWHYHRETYTELEKQLHGYGIGLTAYYSALLAHSPRLLFSLVGLVPTAIRDLCGKDSIRTATMTDFPAGLLRQEMKGMLEGVPAFIRSVREQRRKARS